MLALLEPLQTCFGGQLHDGVCRLANVELHAISKARMVTDGIAFELLGGLVLCLV